MPTADGEAAVAPPKDPGDCGGLGQWGGGERDGGMGGGLHGCAFWWFWSKRDSMFFFFFWLVLVEKYRAIPGLPGGLIIYQGHLFALNGHFWGDGRVGCVRETR